MSSPNRAAKSTGWTTAAIFDFCCVRHRWRCKTLLPALLVCYFLTLTVIVYHVYRSKDVVESWSSYLSAFDRRRNSPSLPLPAGGDFDYSLPKNVTPRNVTILMWTEYYHNKDMTDHIRNECPIPDWCNVTFDRRMLNRSEALVFHIPGTDLDMADLPPRRPEVPWVYFIIEAPTYMQRGAQEFNGYFNRTMSYRLDSDYSSPYGFLQLRSQPLPQNPATLPGFPSKPKPVAWMVSHCSTVGRREALVDALKKRIAVDVFGDCGSLTCDKGREEACYEKLGAEYMFYLSFENSICRDYATEKFSNAVKYNLVPVVYGGGNYSALMPFDNAYIDVRDYRSADELADYLLYLQNNRTAYARYFEWRRYYEVKIRQGFNGFKKLCYALQRGEARRRRVYSDMLQWWTTEADCKNGLDVKWTDVA